MDGEQRLAMPSLDTTMWPLSLGSYCSCSFLSKISHHPSGKPLSNSVGYFLKQEDMEWSGKGRAEGARGNGRGDLVWMQSVVGR